MSTNTDVERMTAEPDESTNGTALGRGGCGASMPALRADPPAAAGPPPRTTMLGRTWTAAHIAAQAGDRIRELLRNFPGASVIAVTHAGITAEGAHARGGRRSMHRLHVLLLGQRATGRLLVPSLSTIELQIALRWHRAAGEFTGHLVGWRVVASQGAFRDGGSLLAALRDHLDAPRAEETIVFQLPIGESCRVVLRMVRTDDDGTVRTQYQLSRAR